MTVQSWKARIEPELVELASCLVGSGEVTVALAAVAKDDQVAWGGAGNMGRLETRFDVASLTKPFAATAALLMNRSGVIDLNARLGDIIEGLPRSGGTARLADLFRHQAGLIPWFPFYSESELLPAIERFTDPGLWRPAEAEPAYSDLGPILWKLLIQQTEPRVGDVLAEAGITATWSPDPATAAATALTNRREVELAAGLGIEVAEQTVERKGIPQDGNARVIPESAHAGLFATASEIIDLGQEWLHPQLLTGAEVESSLRPDGRYAFGWWRASAEEDGLPETAFGHNGFTGCSLWIDRDSARVMTLLAHRTVLSGTLDQARRDFHQRALTIPI